MSALTDKVSELAGHIANKETAEAAILELRERVETAYTELRDLIDGKTPSPIPDGGIAVVEVPETPVEEVAQ